MKKSIYLLMAIVILTIINSCKKDPAPTTLELTLKDELGNVVSGAAVKLYSSQTDWSYDSNQIGTTLTSNATGIVTFTNVSNIKYFWFAEKDCKNNVNGTVSTSNTLTSNVNNTVNVILSSTGTLKFVSTSSNPYRLYVNGVSVTDVNGGTTLNINYLPIGAYSLRLLQLSGYALIPTDITYNGILGCGSTLTTTFP